MYKKNINRMINKSTIIVFLNLNIWKLRLNVKVLGYTVYIQGYDYELYLLNLRLYYN